jgi:hypothetical protein
MRLIGTLVADIEIRCGKRKRPPTDAAFASMLQISDNARQAVDKICNPTIFTLNCFYPQFRLFVIR